MSNLDQAALTFSQPDLNSREEILKQLGISNLQPDSPELELTEASLLEAAQQQTQLSDWGNEQFRVALRQLLKSLNTEANLSVLGRYLFRMELINSLTNRLKLQADFQRYPEILQVPIKRPLFIVGLGRTGSTFLHNLICQDPNSRWLHFWELYFPSPPPEGEISESDFRLQQAQQQVDLLNWVAPQMATAHSLKVTNPEECNVLFGHNFVSVIYELQAYIPSYVNWKRTQDWLSSYRYYRQQLQLLGWHYPDKHWVLKAPFHLFHLDQLLKVFPDACIVWTHRDPLEALPSVCSLTAILRSIYMDSVDLKQIGEDLLDRTVEQVESGMAVRPTAPSEQFYDVYYSDLVQNPVDTVRKIYEHFSYNFTSEHEANMNRWIAENPKNKYGTHRYTLEEFELDKTIVNQRFASYRQQFNL
ncbi:MAG: sulfotransferase [Cyanobacteria bacterium J06592_8]